MRHRLDLSGYWQGRLELNPAIDVSAPAVIEQDFYIPLPWNKQIDHLRWPSETQELSGIVRPTQNQNFRDVMRKFNEGTITYRKMVYVPDGADRHPPSRVFLVFEGSNYRTTARVNGQEVGTHEGGHLGFEFEVTDAIAIGGENHLEITVDNLRSPDAAPQEQFNWQNYGGIYRPVCLEWRPEVYVDAAWVTTGRDGTSWFADVTAQIVGAPRGPVTVQISSGRERQTATLEGGLTRTARVRFVAPVVWELGKGGLSQWTITCPSVSGVTDKVTGLTGFRNADFASGHFILNGKPTRILGASWHEQHPTFGNSVPGWQVTRDIQLMKQVGLNAVRPAHYPHAQAFYDACDREGMLVIAEMPCWQFHPHQFASAKVRDLCCEMARQMVRQLSHHPCIVGWVIQNESKTYEPGAAEFFKAIHDTFKQADPTRFTITAESPAPPEHLTVVKKVSGEPTGGLPPTSAYVDVLGLNCYAGWYADKAEFLPKLLDHVKSLWGNKPLMVTEFGAEGILGQRSLEMHPWTEDYQSELLCRHIRAILDREWVAGFFLWLFIDYEAASISIRGINAKGLVDEYRRPKLAFDTVKALLASRNDLG